MYPSIGELPDSGIRARTLSAMIASAAAQGGLLFEPGPAGTETARLTCAIPDIAGEEWTQNLSHEDLLPRWLRVNATILPLPEASGLWASLPTTCRDRLAQLSVRACVPLVREMDMVAWVFVLGGRPWAESDRRTEVIEAEREAWAEALGAAQAGRERATRATIVARSNRLSLAGHLAANAAHELRNPLAAVRSMVQLVQSGDAPISEHDRLLKTALAEIDRVDEALSRTLTLGRDRDSTWQAIDVTSLVTDAVNFCRAYAQRRGQTIDARCTVPVATRGDRHELRQVLVNVLLNACQASASGDFVNVESGVTESGYASIVVRDGGSGMTSEGLASAFEPFYSTKQDGGGLGLAISRDLVRRHGGDILVQSVVGTGTTVTIHLPLGDPHGPHSRR